MIAIELEHPAYDCLYPALAVEKNCRFVTADELLVRKAGQGRFHERVVSLTGVEEVLR